LTAGTFAGGAAAGGAGARSRAACAEAEEARLAGVLRAGVPRAGVLAITPGVLAGALGAAGLGRAAPSSAGPPSGGLPLGGRPLRLAPHTGATGAAAATPVPAPQLAAALLPFFAGFAALGGELAFVRTGAAGPRSCCGGAPPAACHAVLSELHCGAPGLVYTLYRRPVAVSRSSTDQPGGSSSLGVGRST